MGGAAVVLIHRRTTGIWSVSLTNRIASFDHVHLVLECLPYKYVSHVINKKILHLPLKMYCICSDALQTASNSHHFGVSRSSNNAGIWRLSSGSPVSLMDEASSIVFWWNKFPLHRLQHGARKPQRNCWTITNSLVLWKKYIFIQMSLLIALFHIATIIKKEKPAYHLINRLIISSLECRNDFLQCSSVSTTFHTCIIYWNQNNYLHQTLYNHS